MDWIVADAGLKARARVARFGRTYRAPRLVFQLWALRNGKSFKVKGYAVNAKTAVDQLADRSPRAAAWWREHTPQMLSGRRYFVSDTAACEREPDKIGS